MCSRRHTPLTMAGNKLATIKAIILQEFFLLHLMRHINALTHNNFAEKCNLWLEK